MAEDAESNIAIAVSAKRKLKKNRPREILNTVNILSGSFIIYSLKRAISGLMFIFFSLYSDYSYPLTLSIAGEPS